MKPNHLQLIDLSLAEILSSLSYALDLTGGNPMGHAQRTCLIAMRLGAMYGLASEQLTSLYYAVLMKDAGCSSNAARMFEIFGTDEINLKRRLNLIDTQSLVEAAKFAAGAVLPGKSLLARAARVTDLLIHREKTEALVETRCNRGHAIALKLELGEEAAQCIYSLMERWDGQGSPNRLKGENIPILSRLANVAQHAEVLSRTYGLDSALAIVRKRSGKIFDPEVVNLLLHSREDSVFWETVRADPRGELLALDIRPAAETVTGQRIDAICDVFAQIVDAKSPFSGEHSSRVSDYAVLIGAQYGFDGTRIATLRRAGLLHDIGKLGVPNSILDKPGKLNDREWTSIRLHPYYTNEILSKIPGFARVREIAAAHHERLDGSGYYQGMRAEQLDTEMRILAVADVFDALSAERPYREALPITEVFGIMDKEARSGLDARCLDLLKSATMTLDQIRENAFLRRAA